MSNNFLFTSESVSEGHPDKIADQISDAVLDEILRQDSLARVACETLVKTGMVFIGGEITTNAWVDMEQVARNVIKDIGYTSSTIGFDAASCAVLTAIGKQSPDIAVGVNKASAEKQGAGDQGLMFGYATDETSTFMPAPISYAHRLMRQQALLRKQAKLPWLLPDAKSQVTFAYENNVPQHITSIVLSTQHQPDVTQNTIREAVIEEIIKPIIPESLRANTQYFINPTGRFVIGGPQGDSGLTGRKLMVDTYGGMSRHGGGSFSGKDPSKVDRSAAYAARYIAKNIVAAGLAKRCEIQLAYAIGVEKPISMYVETFGTGILSDEALLARIQQVFDLSPYGIIQMLDLLHPIYRQIAVYGHFGREDLNLSWEKTDKASLLKG